MKTDQKQLSAGRALLLPTAFAAGLIIVGVLRSEPAITRAMIAAAGVLLLWVVALFARAKSTSSEFGLSVVARKPHYVQCTAQLILYAYWGYHVPSIRAFYPLIFAQLVFAYGFSSLLAWSRRHDFELGFGPFPIILSINLFLLFRPEWFHWQFGIIALGYLAKEFIRWEKGGRSAHIFNPSSFPLAVFSLVLILTGTTDTTLGIEIATTLFNPPHMHVLIFLVALPGMLLFGVTTMTLAAAITTYMFGLAYFAATGTYLFFDSYIPIAVFVGMTLLVTDPSTAPRTESGRVIYGVLYGMATIALFGVLRLMDAPTFYDKLLPVPILNLLIQMIDRSVTTGPLKTLSLERVGTALSATQRRVATVGLWGMIFVAFAAADGVGDEHRGQWVPFWQTTCAEGSDRACDYLAVQQQNLCERGAGWSCNELGILLAVEMQDPQEARSVFRYGCNLGFPAACENTVRVEGGSTSLVSAGLTPGDLPIVLRGSKGPVRERDPAALYAIACERGWTSACGSRFVDP